MKLGVIADDFTGASDIALTLAEGGMRVTQFIGVPEADATDVDAGVIALKSRTAPVADAVAQSLAAADWLTRQGAEQLVFKVCSTFDSTADGNIGPVLDALTEKLGAHVVPVTPAFPENGRSVYQGHLFVGDVLLNESGMQNHPLTPMKDADLRRVLTVQSKQDVGHVPMRVVAKDSAAIADALNTSGPIYRIIDGIADSDLIALGAAAKGLPLLCGGSGIAIGLPANFGFEKSTTEFPPITGKRLVISGSCSIATRGQVAEFKKIAPAFEVTAEDAVEGKASAQSLADWVMAQEATPLVYSSADPEVVAAAQARFGQEVAASAIEDLFADLAALLATKGYGGFVTAGGETSGAVVTGLKANALRIGPKIAAGVPMTVSDDDRRLGLVLKSGNFGGPNFFVEALAMMDGVTA